MTLFVDCSNSEFSLITQGINIKEKNLFKRDRESVIDNFMDSNALAVVFKDLPEIGNGFMIFKSAENNSKTIAHIRCTIQTAKSQCLLLKVNVSSNSLLEGTKSKARRILESLSVKFDSKSVLISVSATKLKKAIIQIDSDLSLNRFKFGIAYLDRFDTSEQRMLANTIQDSRDSEGFSHFLQGLGTQINLQGWKGFAGGLDVSDELLTGEKAVYKKYSKESIEIIYHVAPWLPRSDSSYDENNLERKRHFGNDTVVIIYSESLYAFELETLLSQQIQVVCFVRFINRLQKYQIYFYSKLPNLTLETNPIYIDFEQPYDFEQFSQLLMSLERQCYETKPLVDKIYCMRNFHLTQIVNKFI